MRRVLGIMILLLTATGASGQPVPLCTKARANLLGIDKAPITVGDTATQVAVANTARCSLLLTVPQGAASGVMCLAAPDGTPTATTGIPIAIGGSLALGTEGQEEWRCIRTGGSDTEVVVIEGRP